MNRDRYSLFSFCTVILCTFASAAQSGSLRIENHTRSAIYVCYRDWDTDRHGSFREFSSIGAGWNQTFVATCDHTYQFKIYNKRTTEIWEQTRFIDCRSTKVWKVKNGAGKDGGSNWKEICSDRRFPSRIQSRYESKPETPRSTGKDILNEIQFVRLPAGEFIMGRYEKKRVAIPRPFEIGKYEVTVREWDAAMGRKPRLDSSSLYPAKMTWEQVQALLKNLNARIGQYRFRLPTEEEWEYACRAGRSGQIKDEGWYGGQRLHIVGQKKPNPWGIYDMIGNVFEFCEGFYNPTEQPGDRVDRGGCAGCGDTWNNCSRRHDVHPGQTSGLRLVRERR